MMSHENKPIILVPRRSALVFLAFVALIPVSILNKEIFTGFDLSARVEKIDLAEVCYEPNSAFGKSFRSSIPRQSSTSYCGLVFTDHGTFEISTSNEIWPLHDKRSSIILKLKIGCNYNFRIIGYGSIPTKGDLARAPTIQTIIKVRSVGDCLS